MDRRELNHMFDALAPAPGREEALLDGLLRDGKRRKKSMKNWKRIAIGLAAAVLLVGTAAAAVPELLERLTVQLSSDGEGEFEGYAVKGSSMTKYPLSAFSPALNAASEGREGPGVPVSLNFDTWEEVKAFLGEDIPCVWPGEGENWNGRFQVVLFHTERDVLWGVNIYSTDLELSGEVNIQIRTEQWWGSEAEFHYGIGGGGLEQLDSYAMANGAVAEIVQYSEKTEGASFESCTGYFMREGILYRVAMYAGEGPEVRLKALLDRFP